MRTCEHSIPLDDYCPKCENIRNEGRRQCPNCGTMVRVHHLIDGRYLCINCWELAYEVKHKMNWQPMTTAPTDGTAILAVNASTNPNRMFVVHYSEKYRGPWVTDEAPMSWVNGLTHWMQLPPLPTGP
jgi:hypothetical protein